MLSNRTIHENPIGVLTNQWYYGVAYAIYLPLLEAFEILFFFVFVIGWFLSQVHYSNDGISRKKQKRTENIYF
jgi:hypothetical protein